MLIIKWKQILQTCNLFLTTVSGIRILRRPKIMALLPVEKFCVIGVCCCNGTSPSPFESSSSTRSIQDFLSASILKILWCITYSYACIWWTIQCYCWFSNKSGRKNAQVICWMILNIWRWFSVILISFLNIAAVHNFFCFPAIFITVLVFYWDGHSELAQSGKKKELESSMLLVWIISWSYIFILWPYLTLFFILFFEFKNLS